MTPAEIHQGTIDRPTLVWGACLLIAGLLLGLVQFDVLRFSDLVPWWPLATMVGALGAGLGDDPRSRRFGAWLGVIGLWQLINTQGLFGFTWSDSWPLLLIGGGLLDSIWPTCGKERGSGLGLVAVGGWLLLNTRGYFGLSWFDSWPLLMIFAGLAMVLRAVLAAIPVWTGGRPR